MRHVLIHRAQIQIILEMYVVMEHDSLSTEEVRSILSLKHIAVVGMSRDPSKDAHQVPKYLIEHGYDVMPVNPHTDEILGRYCYPQVSAIESPVDVVEIFRPSDQVLPIMHDIIKKRPRVVWLQLGIHDYTSEQLAKDYGIKVVFNRCMLVEHKRFLR